ncbi:hypothetical protein ANCCAN_12085 [Ancylostoma caninum]|uniref:Uncharacterized protein n=1 Tax=Ancylostoma caninum TaxID=29170 RepID=A0A368GG25_ANCCA|nr:hypothetical protein ANCCAN_12085 [Ancylostoma caninum]
MSRKTSFFRSARKWAPAGLESDGEDDGADDENNFSVYECPGLAPTGDIEVCNPNFAAHP